MSTPARQTANDCPVHATAAWVQRGADRAFAYLADPAMLRHWALTTQTVHTLDPSTVRAIGRLDGGISYVRVDAHAGRRTVDYLLGARLDGLVPRISARVTDGTALGTDADHCVITLTAWRTLDMDAMRWRRLLAAHEWEILLLQSLIEAATPPARVDGPGR